MSKPYKNQKVSLAKGSASTTETSEHKIPCIVGFKEGIPRFKYVREDNREYCGAGKDKVIVKGIRTSSSFTTIVSKDYGIVDDGTYAIDYEDEEHRDLILQLFNSKDFFKECKGYVFSGFLINLPKLNLSKSKLKEVLGE